MSTFHIMYLLVSVVLISLIMFVSHFVKEQRWKDMLLIFFSLLCFGIHISNIYTVFFERQGSCSGLENYHILPLYFCNYMMNLLVVTALWPYKNNKTFRCLATFVAWGSIFGGIITNIVQEPNHFDNWISLKSDLSHTAMILAGCYLFVGGYAKLNVFNVIPFAFGLLSSGVFGGLTMWAYVANGMGKPNAMYLLEGPGGFESLTGPIFAILFLLIIFAIGVIWEFIFKKKEDRWYKSIKDIWLYLPKFSRKKATANGAVVEENKTEVVTVKVEDTKENKVEVKETETKEIKTKANKKTNKKNK